MSLISSSVLSSDASAAQSLSKAIPTKGTLLSALKQAGQNALLTEGVFDELLQPINQMALPDSDESEVDDEEAVADEAVAEADNQTEEVTDEASLYLAHMKKTKVSGVTDLSDVIGSQESTAVEASDTAAACSVPAVQTQKEKTSADVVAKDTRSTDEKTTDTSVKTDENTQAEASAVGQGAQKKIEDTASEDTDTVTLSVTDSLKATARQVCDPTAQIQEKASDKAAATDAKATSTAQAQDSASLKASAVQTEGAELKASVAQAQTTGTGLALQADAGTGAGKGAAENVEKTVSTQSLPVTALSENDKAVTPEMAALALKALSKKTAGTEAQAVDAAATAQQTVTTENTGAGKTDAVAANTNSSGTTAIQNLVLDHQTEAQAAQIQISVTAETTKQDTVSGSVTDASSFLQKVTDDLQKLSDSSSATTSFVTPTATSTSAAATATANNVAAASVAASLIKAEVSSQANVTDLEARAVSSLGENTKNVKGQKAGSEETVRSTTSRKTDSDILPFDASSKKTAGSANATQVAKTTTTSASSAAKAVEQVSVLIKRLAKSGDDQLTIQLHPEELGKVEVKMTIDQDKNVQTKIAVEQPATLDLLKQDQSKLVQVLQDAGLQADQGSLQFSLMDGGQSGNSEQGEQRRGNSGGDAGFSLDGEDSLAKATGEEEQSYISRAAVNIRV